jgi:flagellar assembly protein FliH
MRETRLSSSLSSIETLEYRDIGFDPDATEVGGSEPTPAEAVASVGVPEEEVARRLRCAREDAIVETEKRLRVEAEQTRREMQELLAQRLREFEVERATYFKRVEGEIVQLALAVARKIIQREADLDSTLLSGLVRIALDRMQVGPAVRVRVAPTEAERWRQLGRNETGEPRWEVVPDQSVDSADCIVETELGVANFSFEAQLRDVEESFTQLLAYRPAA